MKKVKYIVKLKDNFCMPHTTINTMFCGSIETIEGDNIYFKLNGSNALTIIPHRNIEWMAPSKILWDKGYNKENIYNKGEEIRNNRLTFEW